MSALFGAVERHDLELVGLLLDRGATSDDDTFYHGCEQSDTTRPPIPLAVHVQWVDCGELDTMGIAVRGFVSKRDLLVGKDDPDSAHDSGLRARATR